jgi:hypothetical protein
MIARIRDLLLAILLAVLAGFIGVAGWKLAVLMDRAEEVLIRTEETLSIGRAALAEQRIYYRALSRMAVLDANRLGKAISAVEQAVRNEDTRLAESHRHLDLLVAELQRTAEAATNAVQDFGTTTKALTAQVDALGIESRSLLTQGRAVLATVDERLQDPAISQTSANLAQSSANLERMSAAAADSAEHLRDLLSPKQRSFWIRLLDLMMPRPTVTVGP